MDKRQKRLAEFIEPFRVRPGSKVTLGKDFDPTFKAGVKKKKDGVALLEEGVRLLAEYQARLAAQDTWGVLVVLQAMDTAGKDGTIRHVMSGVNPQGVAVHSFKVPSAEELDHDFLWRYAQRLPERGEIGIFNRSHYEEVAGRPRAPGEPRPPEAAEGGEEGRRLEAALPRDQRLGALPDRQRLPDREAVPEPLEGGAAHAPAAADRPPRPQLEVLLGGRRRARAMGRLPGGVLRDVVAHEHRVGAVVRDPGGSQVVRADRRRGRAGAHADGDRSALPAREQATARGAARGQGGARGAGAEGRRARPVRAGAARRQGRTARPAGAGAGTER